MKFGVIYSIGWDTDQSEECPALSGENSSVMRLFYVTNETGEDLGEPRRYMKFVSTDLLSRADFERFLEHTRLTASSTPTMGSIIGYAWGMGWTAPAVAFEGDSRDYEEMAYVTPIPDVSQQRELTAERMDRCWERVRQAVINTYKDGV